jgi:hypothetical protein
MVLAKMSQASESRLIKQLQGHGFNRPSNGKRFRVKQERSKFKGSTSVNPLYGKVPHIIAQGAEFINPSHFAEVYNLNHQGQCPKTLKVPKDLKESKVEALFGEFVNKNGYKYMQCGNPQLIPCIENLWMVLHQKTQLPSSHLIPIAKTKNIVCEKKGSHVMNWV